MKIGQYCQRQRCKHVELEQFLAGFHVARVSQRYLGFLVCIIFLKNFTNTAFSIIDCVVMLTSDTVLSLVKTVLKPNVDENSQGEASAADNATGSVNVTVGNDDATAAESAVNSSAESCDNSAAGYLAYSISLSRAKF